MIEIGAQFPQSGPIAWPSVDKDIKKILKSYENELEL